MFSLIWFDLCFWYVAVVCVIDECAAVVIFCVFDALVRSLFCF